MPSAWPLSLSETLNFNSWSHDPTHLSLHLAGADALSLAAASQGPASLAHVGYEAGLAGLQLRVLARMKPHIGGWGCRKVVYCIGYCAGPIGCRYVAGTSLWLLITL